MDKLCNKNVFESPFDSFELDDGFLLNVDEEVKANKIKEKSEVNPAKCDLKPSVNVVKSKEENKPNETANSKYYDLALSWDDFNESDLFDTRTMKCSKVSLKGATKGEQGKKGTSKSFNVCLSPIQGPLSFDSKNQSFSSTPLRSNKEPENQQKKNERYDLQKENGKSPKVSENTSWEGELFEDWDKDMKPVEGQKETSNFITLSQAFEMIEEAEAESENQKAESEKEELNQSIDLLTGEIVNSEIRDIGELFEEPFDKLKSVEKAKVEEEEEDCVIICDKTSGRSKSQKRLNFCQAEVDSRQNEKKICFSSDDELFLFSEGLLGESEKKSSGTRCLREESDDSINLGKKRGKCFRIIESDTEEESPSPKFQRKIKKYRKEKDLQGFIDLEAEVSDEVDVSSDEEIDGEEKEEEYEKSFLDEESYLTQNGDANMTARYLESVKCLNRAGSFKIPAAKPYNPVNVFSQIPEESNTDYEIDSFCVNDFEEEMKTDLSDLEIAEQILEMDRKKRKKKSRKFV